MRPLFQLADKQSLKNNQQLPTKGQVYYVASGLVASYATVNNNELVLCIFKTGDVIHEAAVSRQSKLLPLRINLRAYGPARVLRLSTSQFEQQIQSSTDWRQRFESQQHAQFNSLLSRLVALGYKDVYRRLVAHLLFLADRFGSISGNGMVIAAPMTHRQLAAAISSTRETVNKLIKQLEAKELLSMKNKTIRITSPSGLANELEQ